MAETKRTILAVSRVLALGAAAAGGLMTSSGCARADDVSGYFEVGAARFDSELQDARGQALEAGSHSLLQRYRVDVLKSPFPNWSVQAGGVFEQDVVRVLDAGAGIRATTQRLRPYFALRFRGAAELAELTYERNDLRQTTVGAPSTALVREKYAVALGWYPQDLPSVRFGFNRTGLFDTRRVSSDATDVRYQLNTEYRPIEALRLYYAAGANDTKDMLESSEITNLTQNARVTFNELLWKNRMSVFSDYNLNSRRTRTRASGKGEVSFPLLPFAGLSGIDETPEDGALAANPALVDGNLGAGAGIDLGLPPPGGDARARNIALDLSRPTEINTLLVWVDRELRPEIARAFSWAIYTSDDNRSWSFRQIVAPAPFGPFQLRFEIRFANVTARYVKVVTVPLGPSIPFSAEFPNILITEIEGVLSKPVSDLQRRDVATSQIYNLDVRMRLWDALSLYYELNCFLTKTEGARALTTLSNGLSFSRVLADAYTLSARVSREDGQEQLGKRVAYRYTGSLAASVIPALRHTLVFSATNERVATMSRTTRSVLLSTVADLYQGVEAGVILGRSLTSEDGEQSESTQLNANTTLVPHERMTITLSYRNAKNSLPGHFGQNGFERTRQDWEAGLSYRPLATVYAFGSYRLELQTGEKRRSISNMSVDWAPFPDGTIHFNLSYNQTLRSDQSAKDTTLTPSLRWDISRRSFLDVSYQKLTSEASTQKTESSILSGNLRISF